MKHINETLIRRLTIFMVLAFTAACAAPLSPDPATFVANTPIATPLTATPAPTDDASQNWLAFSVKGSGNCSLFIVRANGRELQQIANDVICQRSAPPFVWAPDGLALAYLSGAESGPGLKVVHHLGQKMTQTFDLAAGDWAVPAAPVWQPDGRGLLFTARHNGREDIYAWALDGSPPTNLTGSIPGASFDPRPSPDGKQIAFFIYPKLESRELPHCLDGCPGNLHLMNTDGSEVHKATPFDVTSSTDTRFAECSPAWSTTGRYLAFEVGCNVNVAENIYVLDTETGKLAAITNTEATPLPLVAPHGWLTTDEVVYAKTNLGTATTQTFYLTDVNGSPGQPFFDWQNMNPEMTIDDVSWTGDGRWITGLVAAEDGRTEIVMGDRQTKTLLMSGVRGWSPRWSPSGDRIAYLASPTGHVWIMNREVSEARDLTPNLETIPWVIAWSPH